MLVRKPEGVAGAFKEAVPIVVRGKIFPSAFFFTDKAEHHLEHADISMDFVLFETPFKVAAVVFGRAGDILKQRDDLASYGAGILVKRNPTNRTWFVSDLPAEDDAVLALRAHDVAHGTGRDGDAGGDLVAHRALHLSFQLF